MDELLVAFSITNLEIAVDAASSIPSLTGDKPVWFSSKAFISSNVTKLHRVLVRLAFTRLGTGSFASYRERNLIVNALLFFLREQRCVTTFAQNELNLAI